MVVIFDILSDPPGSLEINRRLFESGVHFINVFSFRRKCISVGKLTKDVNSVKKVLLDGQEEDIPIFRRRTGGGAVLHVPGVDVCFAFTVRNNHSVKRMFHEVSHTIFRFLLRFLREENGVIKENGAIIKENRDIIRENGDIILGGNKVCGIAMARKHRFFLVEGAIILPSESSDKNKAKLDKNKAKSDKNKANLRDIEPKICFPPSSATFQRSRWLSHREFAFELFEFLRSEVKKLCV